MAEGRGRDRERSLDPQKQRGGWSLCEPKVCRGSSRGPASRLKCSLVLKPLSGRKARCPADPSSLGSHSRALPSLVSSCLAAESVQRQDPGPVVHMSPSASHTLRDSGDFYGRKQLWGGAAAVALKPDQ